MEGHRRRVDQAESTCYRKRVKSDGYNVCSRGRGDVGSLKS